MLYSSSNRSKLLKSRNFDYVSMVTKTKFVILIIKKTKKTIKFINISKMTDLTFDIKSLETLLRETKDDSSDDDDQVLFEIKIE